MVVAAIISLQDPVGSHPEDISRWIEVRPSPAFPILTTLQCSVRKAVCDFSVSYGTLQYSAPGPGDHCNSVAR